MSENFSERCASIKRFKYVFALCGLLVVFGDVDAQAQVDLLPDIFAPIGVSFDFGAGNIVNTFEHDISDSVVLGRTHLRISFGTANIGAGAIIFRGLQPPNPDSSLNAVQRIMRSDGTWWERPAGVLAFHPEHGHIHLDDWAQYRLREFLPDGSVGQIVVEGQKTSFCVIDFFSYDLGLPNAAPIGVYNSCAPELQGISVGWIDIYEKSLPGQSIDITDIPNGLYWLEGEFDPENRFLDANRDNNIALKVVTLCHQTVTAPPNDSLWLADAQASAGAQVVVTASVSNERFLSGIVIPFSWDGSLGLKLDSVSVVGTRTDGLTTPSLIAINPFNSSAAYALNFPAGLLTGLPPGSGPVMNIYFTFPFGAALFETNEILLTLVGGQAPLLGDLCGSFTPPTIISGSVTNACCNVAGDADSDGSFNISDVTFGIARIFSQGVAPICQDRADANGDNSFNVADVVYGIAHIFNGGSAPVCGTTGN